MKKFLLTLLFVSNFALGAGDWLTPDGMTKVMEGVDDGTYHVNLGHTFPYYGGVFTDAWMSSNGVIILYDPTTQFGNRQYNNSMCCSGQDLTGGNAWDGFSFMLAPLWTDLRDANLTNDDGYYYSTDEGGSSFLWYNITEYGTTNTNTFQANLWPDGSFDFLYDEVDITRHSTFIGFSGDVTKNETNKLGYYQGSVTEFDIDFHNQTVNGGRAWYGNDGGYAATGPDCSDALNDSSCPGYEEAYFDLQCSYDQLYNSQCPGYDNAILVQNASGTDFVFGDDITDFYNTQPVLEETNMFLSDRNETNMFLSDNNEMSMGQEPPTQNFQQETPPEPETFFEEQQNNFGETSRPERGPEPRPAEEVVYTEPENINISEDRVQIREEITHNEPAMSNNEEVLLREPPPIETATVSTERAAGPTINAVAIALNTVALAESNSVQTASVQSENSVSQSSQNANNVNYMNQSETTFDSFDSAFGDATFEMMLDPTMTVASVTQVDTQSNKQEEQTVDFQMESSTPQQGGGFAEQQNQSFSTGQSISAVLNNVQPNFSKFDVAPPSQQEQQTENKAEAQASNMSDDQLEENLEEFTDQLQDSGGFGDQSMTIFLMGRVNGFANYGGTLQDNPFYTDRGMAGGRVQNDRNAMLRMMGTDNKHEELTSLQYGR